MPHWIDLVQGTPAWLAWRAGGLGGSDMAAVLGLSPWHSGRELWLLKTGQALPQESTFAMRRGLRLEPAAREWYERHAGRRAPAACVQHDEHAWLRASLDGVALFGEVILEIKWPNVDDHQEALGGHVPEHYLPQVHHQLAASGALVCHYLSCSEHRMFDDRQRFALVTVKNDPWWRKRVLEEGAKFWNLVRTRRWEEATA
jgi:putative phage-type endonuclease